MYCHIPWLGKHVQVSNLEGFSVKIWISSCSNNIPSVFHLLNSWYLQLTSPLSLSQSFWMFIFVTSDFEIPNPYSGTLYFSQFQIIYCHSWKCGGILQDLPLQPWQNSNNNCFIFVGLANLLEPTLLWFFVCFSLLNRFPGSGWVTWVPINYFVSPRLSVALTMMLLLYLWQFYFRSCLILLEVINCE